MEKKDVKKIREELEAKQTDKPGFWSRVGKFATDYVVYNPKDFWGYGVSEWPLPSNVKDKLIKKFNLTDYRGNLLEKKLVKRYLNRGEYLKAYEAFWHSRYPPAQKIHARVYHKLGGNKHPVRASALDWLYTSVAHAIIWVPLYAPPEILLGYSNAIPYTAGAIAGFFALAGAPVVYSKWRNSVAKHKAK
ncbi:MAG: hypothetical protein V1836_02445 [Candidatus Aenigmatarchaeota archaeon]